MDAGARFGDTLVMPIARRPLERSSKPRFAGRLEHSRSETGCAAAASKAGAKAGAKAAGNTPKRELSDAQLDKVVGAGARDQTTRTVRAAGDPQPTGCTGGGAYPRR